MPATVSRPTGSWIPSSKLSRSICWKQMAIGWRRLYREKLQCLLHHSKSLRLQQQMYSFEPCNHSTPSFLLRDSSERYCLTQRFSRSCIDLLLVVHLITLSALARTFGGIVRPICLAVLRLITNSNFVGASTGKSPGLAPLRILST